MFAAEAFTGTITDLYLPKKSSRSEERAEYRAAPTTACVTSVRDAD